MPTPSVQQGVAIWNAGRIGAQSVLKTDPLETAMVRLHCPPSYAHLYWSQ